MKNKKPLIALAVLAIVGIIAGTIAFFTSSAEFPNIFHTKTYNTELTEEFKAPEDWTPGQTTDKIVEIKNTGNIALAARVSYTEQWKTADGQIRNNLIEFDGKDGKERAVILNLNPAQKENWVEVEEEQEDGSKKTYFYYKNIIQPSPEGTALEDIPAVRFLDSVTFNKNVSIEYDEVTEYYYEGETEPVQTPDASKKLVKQVKKYSSKKDGYAGAEYTLTIKIETIQADYEAVNTTWGAAAATLLGLTATE